MTAKPFPISSSKTPGHAASPEIRGPIRSSTIPARSGRTYRLFILHHQNARLLLHPPVHQHGAFIYDLGFRRDLITNKGLIEAIDLLYWDTEAPPPQTRCHHPHPPWQPPPPHRRHPATRLQLRPLRHARPRDPATAPAGIRRVAATAAADEGGGEGGRQSIGELTGSLKWPERSKTERWRLAGWLGGVSPPTRQDSKQ